MSVTSSPERQAAGRLGSRKARRRFSPWLLVPIGIILVAAGAFWQFSRSRAATGTTSTATVSRGNLVATVSGSGTITPATTRTLSFPVSGTIAEVLVQVGDKVIAGQPLARLDTTDLEMALRQAEANLKSAEATMASAKGEGATPAEIAAAQAQLRSSQASLSKTRGGDATRTEIEAAEAQLVSAQAQLADLLDGPNADTLSSAQAKVDQAQLTLRSQRESLAAAKEKAESAVTTAANNLRDAQDAYSTIYWQNRELEKAPGELPQANKDNEAAALRAVNTAEVNYKQAQIAYEQAKIAEITGVAQAESSLKDAQEQLRVLKDGATPAEIASARASVASAQSNLDSLRKGGSAADITIAEASVEQAKINLEKLTTPGSATTIASAEAGLAQAQVALAQAKLDLEHGTLTAPFAGVVSEVLVNVGDTVGSSSTITVIDPTNFYVELSLSESDVAKVKLDQSVTLTFDALPDLTIEGKVTTIAPVATVTQNVATYPVRVNFDPGKSGILAGMTASGTITVDQRTDALIVPSRAVQSMGDVEYVQVRPAADQPPIQVRVTTGLSSDGQTEILSCVDTGNQCLQEGDTLVITASSSSTTSTRNGFGSFGGPGVGGPPPGFGR